MASVTIRPTGARILRRLLRKAKCHSDSPSHFRTGHGAPDSPDPTRATGSACGVEDPLRRESRRELAIPDLLLHLAADILHRGM